MSAMNVRQTRFIHLATAAVVLSLCVAGRLAGQSATTDWPSYNRTLTSERYAPLDQIDKNNVASLRQVCVYDLNVDNNFQTGPIVVGRTLYATTDKELVALDAETCQQKWRVREDGPAGGLGVNRGAAYLDGRLFRGTSDGSVAAYDAETGKKIWSTRLADREKGESVPSAPLAWNGLVFVGTAGSDVYGVKGRMYGIEAATGKVVWETYTVPTDAPQPGNEKMQAQAKVTWGNENGIPVTGGGTWSTYSLDAQRGLLYIPTGNPGPDFTNDVRPGDNLYTNSMVAIDLETGAYKWHFQYIAHDVWDLDAVSPVILTEAKGKDGRLRKVAIHGGKTGHVYVHDRATGELIRFSEAMIPQENMWVLPTQNGTRMLPGANGGVEWSPMAVNPKHRLAYAANLHQPMTYHVEEAKYPGGKLWLGGAFKVIPGERQWGRLAAVNIDTGKLAWKVDTEQPLIGGVLATAGDLVFNGEGNGWFRAFDAGTGKKLWEFQCGAGVNAPAVSYTIGGKQYIAVAAGGNTQLDFKRGNSVFVFALP